MVPCNGTENTVRETCLGMDLHKFYFGHAEIEVPLRRPSRYICRTKMLNVMNR